MCYLDDAAERISGLMGSPVRIDPGMVQVGAGPRGGEGGARRFAGDWTGRGQEKAVHKCMEGAWPGGLHVSMVRTQRHAVTAATQVCVAKQGPACCGVLDGPFAYEPFVSKTRYTALQWLKKAPCSFRARPLAMPTPDPLIAPPDWYPPAFPLQDSKPLHPRKFLMRMLTNLRAIYLTTQQVGGPGAVRLRQALPATATRGVVARAPDPSAVRRVSPCRWKAILTSKWVRQ